MSILSLFLLLVVMGVVVYCIITYIPLPPVFKNLILIVAICIAVYYVLAATGIIGRLSSVNVPRL